MVKSILVAKPKTEKLTSHISQELYKRIQAVQDKTQTAWQRRRVSRGPNHRRRFAAGDTPGRSRAVQQN